MRLESPLRTTTFVLQPTAMETIFKFSVMLLLSLTWTTKTNCYKPCFTLPATEVAKKEVKEEKAAPKEMDSFWLTQFMMVEG